jgi:hypothetical protein
MPSITGAQTRSGVKVATAWGTAVACGVGNAFSGEISPSFNVSEITAREIGSGAYMLSNVARGSVIPTVSLTADLGYRNNCDVLLAQFMGTAPAPTEVTVGQADYKHIVTFNTALNSKYVTLAFESSAATVMEFPTCAVQAIGISTTGVPGYLDFTAELLANTVQLSSSVNTNATLATCTFTEGTPELVAVDLDDKFQTNAQSGAAVAGGDQYSVTGFNLSMSRPQEIIPEIKGSAGNSAPIASGLLEGTLSVDVKELADHAMYTIWSAETARKAKIVIEGTKIGATGSNKSVTIYLPRMVLVSEPAYALTDSGTNTMSMEFRLLKAATAPTGMTGSTYPYFEFVNTLATSLLA